MNGIDRGEESSGEATPIEETFEPFLTDKGKGRAGTSGNYRSDAERELYRFLAWLRETNTDRSEPSDQLAEQDEVRARYEPTVDEIDENVFRSYARHLRKQGFAAGTVRIYYAYVSAWCGWATTEGYLVRHYADTDIARSPLPDNDERRPGDQQAWTPEDRNRLTNFADKRASEAIDAIGGDWYQWSDEERKRADINEPAEADQTERAEQECDHEQDRSRARRLYDALIVCRDRALVYILCYTGVRVAEVLRDPGDERREGLRWRDVALEDRHLTVFRKKQEWDRASIPEPVVHPLKIYKRIFNPPTPEWPVFPTFHYPTLAQLAREGLAERGFSEQKIEGKRDEHELDFFVCREYELGPPPSITPNAARKRLKRLCDDAGIDVDDKHGYLAPHGGRRGMGEVMVRQAGFAEAARYLDNSEKMVREAYQHVEAKEQADLVTRALDASDDRVSEPSGETQK